MSQHVMETCNESDGLWLPLVDYSIKSGVSLSTIRRKIKRNDIPYRLEKGKYLILFGGPQELPKPIIPVDQRMYAQTRPEIPEPVSTEVNGAAGKLVEGSVEKSVKMVSDAFEYAISEKDARIHLLEMRNTELEQSVQELRLLVRVLEEKYEIRY